jgi:hypothetical protein
MMLGELENKRHEAIRVLFLAVAKEESFEKMSDLFRFPCTYFVCFPKPNSTPTAHIQTDMQESVLAQA